MINVDWSLILSGLVAGTIMGTVFFTGLALGMRRALRTEHPIRILTLSAALRIAALVAVGWLVIAWGGPWAGLGCAIAFFATRFVATALVRAGVPAGGTP
jgi:F1F0 ATPase subunit 2